MALPNFVVSANLFDIPGSSVGTELVETALADIRVVFKSNLPEDRFITFGGVMYRPPIKVYAEVADDGAIVRNGNPVRLLGNDPGLSVSGIQWAVQVLIPAVAGRQQVMAPWTFNALGDGDVLSLATTTPVPALPPIDLNAYVVDGGGFL